MKTADPASNPLSRRQFAGTVASSLLPGSVALGQAKQSPSVFRKLFPNPTGRNGYEDLVQAGELLATSAMFARAERVLSVGSAQTGSDPGAADLSYRRRTLVDRPVDRAATLVAAGLQKPITPPPIRDGSPVMMPEELPLFRRLGRLLVLQQFVAFADGKVAQGIGFTRSGLEIARVLYGSSLISALVGVAIGSLCTRSLYSHIDQLALRDCDLLARVCQEWLSKQSPLELVVLGERQVTLKSGLQTGDEPGSATLLGLTPARWTQAVDQFYGPILTEARKPSHERRPPTPRVEPPAGELLKLLLPPMEQAFRSFSSDEAAVKLLATHALVRKYRWEMGSLPDSLAALRADALTIDPFTGAPVVYQKKGSRYWLYSAGPLARESDANSRDGRVPVALAPDDVG